jgi:hypothetical protein
MAEDIYVVFTKSAIEGTRNGAITDLYGASVVFSCRDCLVGMTTQEGDGCDNF